LRRVLEHYDEIMAVMLPSLREERAKSYSPFLPISPTTGRVLQVPILETNAIAGTIVFEDEDGKKTEVPVTGGHTKLQWKPDWGMRWAALDVNYEMSGKDLIPSVELASKICRILGSTPPETYIYELFLDDRGQKISKSKGNGLSVEEWLAYAPAESLALFMFQKPRAAKRLYFDVIPRAVDDYLSFVDKAATEDPAKRLENPAWHIHNGAVPTVRADLSFNLLLNLAGAAHAETKAAMWGFISRYAPEATPDNAPFLDRLADHALHYYRDFVLPTKRTRAPTGDEAAALRDLNHELESLPAGAGAEAIQATVYEVGKRHPFPDLKAWFQTLYELLLGQTTGPRMGSFIELYGITETRTLIRTALERRDALG
jgi:lysyl-tRNA synthetase class 1